jgi:hypothetical protein
MSQLDDATSVKRGINLDGVLGIFQGSIDPSVSGWDAPIGSLFIRTNGSLYQKETAPTTGWVLKLTGAHKDTHKSGGSDAFTSTDLLEAVVKRLQETSGPDILGIGSITDGQYLQRVGSDIIGIDPSSVGPDRDFGNVAPNVGSTTTSKTYVDLPGAVLNTSNSPAVARDYMIVFSGSFSVSPSGKSILARFVFDGVPDADSERELEASSAGAPNTLALNHVGPLAADTEIKIEWKVAGTGSPEAEIFFGTISYFGSET